MNNVKNKDIQNLINKDPTLMNNKYFKNILLSYYSLSRQKHILECIEDFEKNENLIEKLFEEYQLYLAGYDVTLDEVDGSDLVLPDSSSMKTVNIMSILKKTPKM